MKNEEIAAEVCTPDEAASLEPPSILRNTTEQVKASNRTQSPTLQTLSLRSSEFKARYFPNTTADEWNNWHWQIRNSFTSVEQIRRILNLSEDEAGSKESVNHVPIRITPYYASLLNPNDPNQALRRTVVPVVQELIRSAGEMTDPLNEMHDSPVPHIVHRYPDRVLFLVTNFCSAFCRYCTRTHTVSKGKKAHPGPEEWDKAIEYLENHTEVRDVILSGGDPLTLSDNRLENLLSRLRRIPHIEIIRIGTKVPVVMPQRITPELLRVLRRHHPLFMSIHFTHPQEITPEVAQACNRLADAGIPMGSQTVLLKGINDEITVFKKLVHELLKIRVRPYYLYQCDPIPGSSHFRTPVQTGLDMIQNLRGFTSGYAIPHYVIDAPGGGGKIPLLPDYLAGKENNDLLLRNYQGQIYRFPDYI